MNCILPEFNGTEKENYARDWMWWHMPVIAAALRASHEDHLSLRDQGQPGQRRFYLKKKEKTKIFVFF